MGRMTSKGKGGKGKWLAALSVGGKERRRRRGGGRGHFQRDNKEPREKARGGREFDVGKYGRNTVFSSL